MLKAASLVLQEDNRKKLAKISLFDSAVKTHAEEIAQDIELQALEKMKSCAFAIQYDKTTDIAQMSQLLLYIRFVESTLIEEEILFRKSP